MLRVKKNHNYLVYFCQVIDFGQLIDQKVNLGKQCVFSYGQLKVDHSAFEPNEICHTID